MADTRLKNDRVYRWYLASPLAFADWTQPTAAELNANPTNDPSGLIYNLTCAINVDNSQFDLDDPDTDDSLTFCQVAGNEEVLSRSATVVFNLAQAKERWTDAASTSAPNFNTATLAQSLLTWRGVEYFAILSVGEADNAPFATGDRIKMARVITDNIAPDIATGSNVGLTQTMGFRSDLNWNYEVAS